jgi:hypothetical protein
MPNSRIARGSAAVSGIIRCWPILGKQGGSREAAKGTYIDARNRRILEDNRRQIAETEQRQREFEERQRKELESAKERDRQAYRERGWPSG